MTPASPERIWLLDYGSGDCVWCDCPDPDSEDHEAVEYVRADTAAAAIEMWRQQAQGTEAQRATTVEQGVVHDGPVRDSECAQTSSGGDQ